MNKTKLYESPDVTIFLWQGGPEVGVVKADIYKSVDCCKITDASDHFPIYVDITIRKDAPTLTEEKYSLGTYEAISENW